MEHIFNNTQENIDSVKQNQANIRREESKMRKDCPAIILMFHLKIDINLSTGFTWNLFYYEMYGIRK